MADSTVVAEIARNPRYTQTHSTRRRSRWHRITPLGKKPVSTVTTIETRRQTMQLKVSILAALQF